MLYEVVTGLCDLCGSLVPKELGTQSYMFLIDSSGDNCALAREQCAELTKVLDFGNKGLLPSISAMTVNTFIVGYTESDVKSLAEAAGIPYTSIYEKYSPGNGREAAKLCSDFMTRELSEIADYALTYQMDICRWRWLQTCSLCALLRMSSLQCFLQFCAYILRGDCTSDTVTELCTMGYHNLFEKLAYAPRDRSITTYGLDEVRSFEKFLFKLNPTLYWRYK